MTVTDPREDRAYENRIRVILKKKDGKRTGNATGNATDRWHFQLETDICFR